jgi:hypothetical protein
MPAHVVGDGGIRILHAVLGIVAGALTAAAAVAAVVASFDLNPVGPVVVVAAAVVAGVLLGRRVRDFLARGAAIGLVVGSLLAVLLWPLFSA